MEKMKVRELMRPVEEFPRISSRSTFMEAVDALEKAQEEFGSGKRSQRILLVYDEDGEIVGKLSPMDVVQGLEPCYENIDSLSRHQLSPILLESMKEELRFWQNPLSDLCRKAYNMKIEKFVRLPTAERMVNADDRMTRAFHLFVMGRHDSLFVRDGKKIVGLIRFSDVYKKIAQTMRECPISA